MKERKGNDGNIVGVDGLSSGWLQRRELIVGVHGSSEINEKLTD